MKQERLVQGIAELVTDRLATGPFPVVSSPSSTPAELDADTQEQSLTIADEFLSSWC